jgi:acyl-coenzyme A synthetase/AMP-(fatty) acid ligase
MVGSTGGLVYHSHTSLVAWAVSWSAFLPLSEESVVLTLEPLWRWGGLLACLPALFRGAACAFVTARDMAEIAAAVRRYRPSHLIVSFAAAAALASREDAGLRRALRESAEGVFVVVERPFSVRERRHLDAALGVPVLTLLGSPETGPALASHPTWYLDEAVGIPVTNVDVWPLNPSTRDALAVPWEAVEFGELGVRSPMVAADYQVPEERAASVVEEWVRLGLVATMDPNGLFYLRH